MQLRADKRVREITKQNNDIQIMAITSKELIEKEACYHASCYQAYIIPANKKKLPSQASNYNTDEGFCHIWKFLSDLFESPEVRVFKTLQDLVETTSTKKNLKRTNEAKTN